MQQSIGDAAEGGLKAQEKFQRLGINFDDLFAQDPAAQFETIGKALGSIENPTLRAARAVDIFGKSGRQLLPLFGDSGGIATARARLGELPNIMARITPALDEIGDILGTFPQKIRGFFAGFAEPFAPDLLAAIKKLEFIDLSQAGERVGAFVKFAIDSIKAGKIQEFLSLSIDAGFELAQGYATEFINFLTTNVPWVNVGKALATGLIDGIKNFAIALERILASAFLPLNSLLIQWADRMRFKFEVLIQILKGGFVVAANFLIDGLNSAGRKLQELFTAFSGIQLPLFNIEKIQQTTTAIAPLLTATEAYAEASRESADNVANFTRGITDLAEQLKKTLGLTFAAYELDGKRVTALQKLSALLDEIIKKSKEQGEAARKLGESNIVGTRPLPEFDLNKNNLDLKQKLFDLEQQRAFVDANFATSTAEKQAQHLVLLEQERKLQQDNLDLLYAKAAETDNLAEREKILGEAEQARQQLGHTEVAIAHEGPVATSITDNLVAQIGELKTQIGTVAQQIARTFSTVIRGGIDAVAQGMAGLLKGTLTWSQALKQIGGSIFNTIIDAISRMFAEWVVGLLFKSAVTKSTAAADTAAKAPVALLDSISTGGLAVLAGVAAFTAAMALVGGFAQGGYTGAGNPNDLAGMVHRGEYVIPAGDVRQIGLPAIEAFRADAGAQANAATAPAAPIENNVSVYAFDSRETAMKRWLESTEGRAVFVDMARKNAHLFTRS
ncbi:MAG: hypothetical protein DMF62_03165 [Acidobacteria bacterium]|nr:MAG: hypothetical protein DMF62_03165 [Acidobacteriota bacterium]